MIGTLNDDMCKWWSREGDDGAHWLLNVLNSIVTCKTLFSRTHTHAHLQSFTHLTQGYGCVGIMCKHCQMVPLWSQQQQDVDIQRRHWPNECKWRWTGPCETCSQLRRSSPRPSKNALLFFFPITSTSITHGEFHIYAHVWVSLCQSLVISEQANHTSLR